MLIKCEDCGHDVSDKAVACLYCGCPINPNNSTPTVKQAPKRALFKRRKPMRRANGTGSVRFLGNSRRNPYAAYPPITDYHENGSPILPAAIGYYPTYNDAVEALNEYTKNPYDLESRQLTFSELYEKFIKFKFEESKKVYSKSARATLESAYKHCSNLYDMPFISIRADVLQKVLDDCPLKRSSVEHILSLLHQISEYAIKIGVTDKDFSQYIKISIPDDDESGEPFYEDEIKKLWKDSESPITQKILIMIYTGFRIGAFETIKVNVEEQYLQGGIKTKAGKDRIVPIHPAISSFITSDTFSDFKSKSFRNLMDEKLMELKLATSKSGKKHTPHDCRHTFSWLCDKYEVDQFSKHLLMGHSIQGDVEAKVYNHRTIEQLRTELLKIKVEK